jgi:phosphoglycerate dehydrogenase-like enzyme
VSPPRCAVLPDDDGDGARSASLEALRQAVRDGGGTPTGIAEADCVVWTDAREAGELRSLLDAHPQVRWVQLPWAGIEPFVDVLDHDRRWTCGKGVYAEPVAEHALALALAGMRGIGGVRDEHHVVGSGGHGTSSAGGSRSSAVARSRSSLIRLLRPWGAHLTVVRRHPRPMDGVAEVVGQDELLPALGTERSRHPRARADPETERIIDAEALSAMPEHAWLVNVARGQHVDTDALVDALRAGTLGGAGFDVTDPEPLPDGHPLWSLPDVIVTPHVGNTPEMGRVLLAARVRDNVRRFAEGRPLLGPVDVELGY